MERSTNYKVFSIFPDSPNSSSSTTRYSTFERPLLIGDFSLDEAQNFLPDNTSRSLVTLDWDQSGSKSVKFDLNESMNKVVRKDISPERHRNKLKNLLSWILLNKSKFTSLNASQQDKYQQGTVPSTSSQQSYSAGAKYSSSKSADSIKDLATDFVCYRGELKDVMDSPYDTKGSWITLATKFGKTIYLCGAESPEEKKRRLNQSDEDKKMSSWGCKFEHYMTDGANPKDGNNENKEYHCVLRSRLGAHSLVFAAEVDGVDPSYPAQPHATLEHCLELKTSKQVSSDWEIEKLEKFKFKKWWIQSVLAGIPRIVCGFRDDYGMVNSLQLYEVSSLPNLSKAYWSPQAMIDCLVRFLDWLKETLEDEDNPKMVYKLTRKPGSRSVICECLGDDSSKALLPPSYVDNIFTANA